MRWEYCSAEEMYREKVFCRVGRGETSGERDDKDDSAEMALLAVSYFGQL